MESPKTAHCECGAEVDKYGATGIYRGEVWTLLCDGCAEKQNRREIEAKHPPSASEPPYKSIDGDPNIVGVCSPEEADDAIEWNGDGDDYDPTSFLREPYRGFRSAVATGVYPD